MSPLKQMYNELRPYVLYMDRQMNNSNRNGPSDFLVKFNRLATGEAPRVVDLFAGCGGLSLGFHRAGSSILGVVEMDAKAAQTHARNFFKGESEEFLSKHAEPRDITSFSPSDFMQEICGAEVPFNLVDVIIGGPPCQAFARIGRAKIRNIMNHPQAFLNDDRASLYIYFLEYVEFFRPLVVLIENVPDILNYGGRNVAEEIVASLDDMGYESRYTLLNTANYGVPQFRLRFILIAFLKEMHIKPNFPQPTHRADIPIGYQYNRAVALKMLEPAQKKIANQKELFDIQLANGFFVEPGEPDEKLPQAVSAQEALEDLPLLYEHLNREKRHIVRAFDKQLPYRNNVQLSEFATQMREWPSFEAGKSIRDHVIRFLPRDYEIFKRMKPGEEYPRAHEIAVEIFLERLGAREQELGKLIPEGSDEYKKLWKECVPPYNTEKFPNKWWKLIPQAPSRTLTAHISKDTYSHIHYDSNQARVISVREAARLQSFPDGFEFTGPMNPAFKQIGNAVPPS